MELMTWVEVQNELQEVGNKNLLLGNGFSISYKADDFNQKSIIQEIDFLKNSTDVSDIEECIAKTQELVAEGSTCTVPGEIIRKWIKSTIHKAFIEKLFAKMPSTVRAKNDYNENTLVPYKNFLAEFNKFYTLNYDPLLYWMSLHFVNNGDKDVQAVMKAEEKYNKAKEGSKTKETSKTQFYEKVTTCMSKIREKIFVTKAHKDKYKMKVYFGDKCLYDETLSKAEADKTISLDKITNTICSNMEKISDENTDVKEEFERIELNVKNDFDSKKAEIIAINNGIKIEFNDGFLPNKETKRLEWNNENSQNVYFLHGAFHILQKDNSIVKIKADPTATMLKNIQDEWNNNYDSLTILESTAKNKEEQINKNSYLKYCFDNFKNQTGVLVTLGVSFYDSDNHIIDSINENDNISQVYIGCYEEPTEELLNKFKDNPKVKYFSTKGIFDICN